MDQLIDVLSKQIEQYQKQSDQKFQQQQKQNADDHREIRSKQDKMLDLLHSLVQQQHSAEKRTMDLQAGQSETNKRVDDMDGRLGDVEKKMDQRDHLLAWIAKAIGIIGVVGGIVFGIIKLNG